MRPGILLALALGVPGTAPAAVPPASAAVEARLAADVAFYAPPDLKRQLVRHRARLMQGVADAARDAGAGRDAAAHREAALRAARDLASRIRGHERFADVAYAAGGLVHACAALSGLPAAVPEKARFLGFPPDPFRSPERLLDLPAASAGWDAALTRATRLLAFAWKGAGGDASIATRLPEAKGPYPVRD